MDFRKKVVYQAYPKSFKDSNGDGVGDLRGIIEKLPYLKKLGIDVVWFNPFFPSPQNDNGYDISDYKNIDPMFGTMDDFEELVKKMQDLDMEIMLDMVLNHTSTDHIWFKKALLGDKKYQDYYILRKPQANGELPTNWVSKFGGPAWAKFGDTNMYYLHLFDKTQADLNWRNPEVRAEAADIVNFWIDKGVTGFRFDVINLIGKDEELVDAEDGVGKSLYTDKPIVHEYLKELNERTFGRINSITVGEMSSTSIENCILYTRPERHELSMTFNFHHLKVDYVDGEKWSLTPYRFDELTKLLHTWNEEMSKGNGWNAWFWNNHDQPRALTRFGNDSEYRIESAKMLATAIHLNRGTPFVYQGEEIGMTDPYFEDLSQYRDVESLNYYDIMISDGKTHEEAIEIIKSKSRDNSRTPMQWSDELSGGFTTGTPWIPVADNYLEINVERELAEGSIFKYYQELISLRKRDDVISFGEYLAYDRNHPDIYAFIREYENNKILVLNNFKDHESSIELAEEWLEGDLIINNYDESVSLERLLKLRPFESLAIKI